MLRGPDYISNVFASDMTILTEVYSHAWSHNTSLLPLLWKYDHIIAILKKK